MVKDPKYHARQISGEDDKGHSILSVIVKRSYRVDDNGRCIPDIESLPLTEELIYHPDTDDELLDQAFDLFAFKPCTDVVVKGNAQSGKKETQFAVEVQVGNHRTSLLVIGNRKAKMKRNRQVVFTNPGVIEKVPLRYDHAYGGWDKIGEYKLETHDKERMEQVEGIDWEKGSPYRYFRNPVGKGYLVHLNAEAVEQLELPNLEDPKDRLMPDRIAAGEWKNWVNMPIPRCTDWVPPTWFPRYTYFGLPPDPANPASELEEVLRGWAPSDVLTRKSPQEKFSFRCTNGASLGLQMPFLTGNEHCHITNVHPLKTDFSFYLPGEIPKIWVDGRDGKLKEASSTVIHTVIIEPEENRVTLIWRGSARAKRPYMLAELEKMPFNVVW